MIITLPDITQPVVSSFTIPATASSLTVSISTFTATDVVGVTGYLLTESTSTPLASDAGWQVTAPTTYTFSTEGTKTLYAFAKDAAGNVSTSLNDQVIITLFISPPPNTGGGSSGGGGGGGGSSYTPPVNNNLLTSTSTLATTTVSTATSTSINTNNVDNVVVGANNDVNNISQKELEKITLAAKEFIATENKLVTKINNTFSNLLAGRLLLQVENKGEAWYVNPKNNLKYYLGTPNMAFSIMRTLGIGISNSNLEKVKIANYNLANGIDSDNDGLSDAFEDAIGSNKNSKDTDSDSYDDKTEVINSYSTQGKPKLGVDEIFAKNQGGKIFIQVQGHGEAWYVNPLTNTRYYLGRPDDAYLLMRYLSLGISNSNLRKIGVGTIE